MLVVRRPDQVRVVEIQAKSVLNKVANMPFAWSINPYQGCAHQCVFCYARATHAYRELDGVDQWGAVIYAKVNAPAVVRAELRRRTWRNDEVAIGTATDPYQSIEGRYRLTRGILRELARARTPMHLITRSGLILRDLDVLTEYAARAEISICVSVPTLDAALARELEPTVAPPAKRLETVQRLAAAGIRVGVAVAPVLPALTDDRDSLAALIQAAADAGAAFVWHGLLNLGDVTRDAFFAYLRERRPELVGRYDALYAARYASRSYARVVAQRFAAAQRGISLHPPQAIRAPAMPREISLLPDDRAFGAPTAHYSRVAAMSER